MCYLSNIGKTETVDMTDLEQTKKDTTRKKILGCKAHSRLQQD